jgi:hypothetical protein
MRISRRPRFARQHSTKLLQSVALTNGTGNSHFCEALGRLASGPAAPWRVSIEELGALVRRHRADDTISKAIRQIPAST